MDADGVVCGRIVIGWAAENLATNFLLVDLVDGVLEDLVADVDEHLPQPDRLSQIVAACYLFYKAPLAFLHVAGVGLLHFSEPFYALLKNRATRLKKRY